MMCYIKNNILTIIKNLKQIDSVEIDEPLIDNGIIDSFDLIQLITEIEKKFNIQIDAEDITSDNFFNISTIVKLIKQIQC